MRLALVCFYCLCVFVYVLYFIATMSFAGYILSVLFCMLSMLISDSRFDLVWFRLSCDHGWIRSGSVNVRKQQQQQQQQPSARSCAVWVDNDKDNVCTPYLPAGLKCPPSSKIISLITRREAYLNTLSVLSRLCFCTSNDGVDGSGRCFLDYEDRLHTTDRIILTG